MSLIDMSQTNDSQLLYCIDVIWTDAFASLLPVRAHACLPICFEVQTCSDWHGHARNHAHSHPARISAMHSSTLKPGLLDTVLVSLARHLHAAYAVIRLHSCRVTGSIPTLQQPHKCVFGQRRSAACTCRKLPCLSKRIECRWKVVVKSSVFSRYLLQEHLEGYGGSYYLPCLQANYGTVCRNRGLIAGQSF